MDEGSGSLIHDSSNKKLIGELKNNVAWIDGVEGKGINFNGKKQYCIIKDAEILDGFDKLTVSVWVKISENPKMYYAPIAKLNYRIIINKNGMGHFVVKTDNNEWYSKGTYANLSKSLILNKWNNIVGTYDGENVKVYLNGNLAGIGEATISGKIPKLNSPILLGSGGGDLGDHIEFMNGSIDNVQIYSGALTAFEIKDNFIKKFTK